MRFMKPLVLFAALATACATSPASPTHHKLGAATSQTISASYDPSVSGLPGAVGDIVSVAGGASAWVKSGTGVTAWQAFPGTTGISCASDPRVAPGLTANVGQICTNGSTLGFAKFGTADTDWVAFPGNATVTTVSVDATDVDVTGLNGNIDCDYRLSGYVIFANSATGTLTLKPNNITANQVGLLQSVVGAQAPSTSPLTSILLTAFAADASGTPSFFFQARSTSLTGRPRRIFWTGQDFTGVSTRRKLDGTVMWSDTTTNITSWRYSMTGSSALIKAGSFFVTEPIGTCS